MVLLQTMQPVNVVPRRARYQVQAYAARNLSTDVMFFQRACNSMAFMQTTQIASVVWPRVLRVLDYIVTRRAAPVTLDRHALSLTVGLQMMQRVNVVLLCVQRIQGCIVLNQQILVSTRCVPTPMGSVQTTISVFVALQFVRQRQDCIVTSLATPVELFRPVPKLMASLRTTQPVYVVLNRVLQLQAYIVTSRPTPVVLFRPVPNLMA
jgi:hypothetical protein